MLNTNLTSKGASFIANSSDHNPRDFVIGLLKKRPDAPRKELFEDFRTLLEQGDDHYRRAVEWYFFVNMYEYLMTNRQRDPVERARDTNRRREVVESIKAQIVLLDLTMPNGKPMRDCTGSEMATFGNRFQKIAERVGKAKTVGSVLDEAQVKSIMA